MLTLYVKTGCAYCAMVLHELAELNIPFEEKNVSDEAVAAELIEIGGDRQTPCLIDSDKGIAMYESSDIVEYLAKTYGDGKAKPQEAPNVCLPE